MGDFLTIRVSGLGSDEVSILLVPFEQTSKAGDLFDDGKLPLLERTTAGTSGTVERRVQIKPSLQTNDERGSSTIEPGVWTIALAAEAPGSRHVRSFGQVAIEP
jgi:hypothetical protein